MKGEEFKHDATAKEWVDPYPKKKGKLGWLVWPVVFLMVYVLSIGPVALMGWNRKIPRSCYNFIDQKLYFPIYIAAERMPFFQSLLNSYIDLWMPDRSKSNHP